jgi:membrane protease YdiL (CAAX protease family)
LIEKQSDETPWTIRQTFIGMLATLVPWIILSAGLNSLGGSKSAPTGPLSPQVDLRVALITFAFSCIVEGALLIAPLYIANKTLRSTPLHGRGALQALGFRGFRGGATLTWMAAFLFAILAADYLYGYVIQTFHLPLQTNDQVLLALSKYAPLTTYATLIVAVFVAPICEEVFFRGFVFAGLLRGMPLVWAIVFSSLIFGVAHFDVGSFAVLFIIGLALAFLRWRTRSIWPGIMLHMLNNGIAALGIIVVMLGGKGP